MWPHAHTYPPHAHIPHAHTLHMPTVVDVISKYQFWPLTLWHHFVPGFRLHTHTSSLARWKTHIISKTFEIACSYCCWNALSSLVEIALPLLNVVVSAITTSHHDDHSKKHFWCCCLLLCCSAVWDIYMSRCVCVCVSAHCDFCERFQKHIWRIVHTFHLTVFIQCICCCCLLFLLLFCSAVNAFLAGECECVLAHTLLLFRLQLPTQVTWFTCPRVCAGTAVYPLHYFCIVVVVILFLLLLFTPFYSARIFYFHLLCCTEMKSSVSGASIPPHTESVLCGPSTSLLVSGIKYIIYKTESFHNFLVLLFTMPYYLWIVWASPFVARAYTQTKNAHTHGVYADNERSHGATR